jgi:hypothetical protein
MTLSDAERTLLRVLIEKCGLTRWSFREGMGMMPNPDGKYVKWEELVHECSEPR